MSSRRMALIAIAVMAGTAGADVLDEDRPMERRGFVVGGHGGWGGFPRARCAACDDHFAGVAGLRLGSMIGSRVALLAGVEWGGNGERVVVSLHLLSRWFLAERWWFDAGVGAGRVDVDEGRERRSTFTGTSVQIGGGYDLYQGDAFAFDGSLRSMYVRSEVVGGDRTRGDLMLTLQLGATWY
jgi:hypothetical protein